MRRPRRCARRSSPSSPMRSADQSVGTPCARPVDRAREPLPPFGERREARHVERRRRGRQRSRLRVPGEEAGGPGRGAGGVGRGMDRHAGERRERAAVERVPRERSLDDDPPAAAGEAEAGAGDEGQVEIGRGGPPGGRQAARVAEPRAAPRREGADARPRRSGAAPPRPRRRAARSAGPAAAGASPTSAAYSRPPMKRAVGTARPRASTLASKSRAGSSPPRSPPTVITIVQVPDETTVKGASARRSHGSSEALESWMPQTTGVAGSIPVAAATLAAPDRGSARRARPAGTAPASRRARPATRSARRRAPRGRCGSRAR